VYLNEKNMDLEVGTDVYDVPAPKKIRCLVGIQLCTLTKKTWSWKLESMCTMYKPRNKSGSWLGSNCVPQRKKHGFRSWNRCVRCASPEKNQVPGWDPIVYLNDKKLDFEVGIDVYDVPVSKKKKQVPGWNPIVYLNEKKLDLEVGIDVYDVPAPKKIRCLAGIQLCTLTKKSWIWELEVMCTMCQPRKKQVPGWIPIVYLNEKKLDLEVGTDVYDGPAPEKKKLPGWDPIVYLNEKKLDLAVGIDVYDVPAQKKTRSLAGIQLCTLTKKSWIWELELMCTMCQPRKKPGPWLESNCVP
jgi:hypothetical protein